MKVDARKERLDVGFYGHTRQYRNLKAELDAAIHVVLESSQYVQGPALKRFEEELAAHAGANYCVGVGNGTDALWLTFMALGLGEGDEVITNANTFFATAEAIWIAGCTVMLADCDPRTKCIDPETVRRAINKRTRAIVPVHLSVLPCAKFVRLRTNTGC